MSKVGNFINRFPLIVFVLALATLFAILFYGEKTRKAEVEEAADGSSIVRDVDVFDASGSISVPVLAEVDRADTITLVATTSGIVTRVAGENQFVYHGTEVMRLSDTYSGSSQAATNVALAKRALEYQEEVYDDQETILEIQEDAINKTDRDEIKIARKQVSLQEEANEFNLDNAQLKLKQANASLALYRTVAPFTGKIQSTFVRVGDRVNAGDPIAVLKAENQADTKIVAYVGKSRAAAINLGGDVIAHIDGQEVPLTIVHIASAPTKAGSYAITLGVPMEQSSLASDGSFIKVDLPIAVDEGEILAPLDAVHYGENGPEIYVIRESVAVAVPVELGAVMGSYVIIRSGLADGEQVITTRGISAGESVQSSTNQTN